MIKTSIKTYGEYNKALLTITKNEIGYSIKLEVYEAYKYAAGTKIISFNDTLIKNSFILQGINYQNIINNFIITSEGVIALNDHNSTYESYFIGYQDNLCI